MCKISNDPSGFTEKIALFVDIQQITLFLLEIPGDILAR